MSENPLTSGNASSLVDRAKSIIMSPTTEWPKIAAETTSTKDVFLSYAVPLAAIGPVCGLIGGQIFGYGALGFHYRPSLVASISTAITTYVLSLASLFVVAFIANFLSSKFGGRDSFEKAFKLCAYSFTASWLAGVFQLVPMLSILGLLGLYSFYLFYTGVTPLMAVPGDKALSYTAVTVVAAIVIFLIVGALATSITGSFAASTMASMDSGDNVTMTIPGVGKIEGSNGQSTIEMPGVGTIRVDENSGTTTIQGNMDGRDFHAEVQTED